MAAPGGKEAVGTVTLGDATVHDEDVALLTAPNWLNDNLISLWCEHLRINVVRNDARVLFILPNMAFFLRQCHDADDVAAVTAGLVRATHELVVVPVNDSADDGSFAHGAGAGAGASGTHWSVLAYARGGDQFLAFDSLGGRNGAVAAALARKLAGVVRPRDAQRRAVAVRQCASPRQQNSYDCGAHACAVMAHLARQFCDSGSVAVEVPGGLCMQSVRDEMRALIAGCKPRQ